VQLKLKGTATWPHSSSDTCLRHVQHRAVVIRSLRTLNAFVASLWLQVALVLATLLVAGLAAESGMF